MPEPEGPTRSRRRWLEPQVLAVAGLVLAAVPCCPMTGLTGAFLGVLALRRIRLSEGELRGARLAMAAIVIGAASAFIWSVLLDRFGEAQQDAMRDEMVAAVTTAVQAAQAEDFAALLDTWSTEPPRPTAEEIASFGQTAHARYGPLDRFGFISMARSGTLFRPIVDVAGVGHFERDEPLLAARFEMRVVMGRVAPVVRLLQLTVEDERRGDVTLGPVRSEPAAATGAPK